jgi:hypothetical protein
LQSAGTTAITIDTSQNVGIGTASPTQKLQVAGNAFISAGQYFMWDNAGAWALQSDASTYVRTFIAGNEKMRVNAYGIGVGGAIPSSGTGITFPATQSASSDANTLDDYEEGVWSASTISTSNCTSVTFSQGRYTKIGNIVSIQGTFTLAVTTANTLTYLAMNTPFTPLNTTSGSVMDNQSLVSGSGQAANNGVAYGYFAASALLPAGATSWYVNYQYQI